MIKLQSKLSKYERARPIISASNPAKTEGPLVWLHRKSYPEPDKELEIEVFWGSMPTAHLHQTENAWEYYHYSTRERLTYTSENEKIFSTFLENEFVHIDFVNDPNRKEGVKRAIDIEAKLSFYDKDKRLVLGEVIGRRKNTIEPTKLESDAVPRDFIVIDISANNSESRLNVAVKAPKDAMCYAYSPDWFGLS